MGASVVVTYSVKPESLAEHVRLIAAVFDQLATEGIASVDYQVLRLDDGVSFVHVSTAHTPDGVSPLPGLSSFQAFTRDLSARVVAPPTAAPAERLAAHIGSRPPTD